MPSEPSIKRWLKGIRQGKEEAAEELWACCFPDLVRFARAKLAGVPRRVADEEDVALSAMGRVRGDSVFGEGSQTGAGGCSPVDGTQTPEVAAAMADEVRRLLALLPDPDVRQLALGKMEGYTNEELAQELQCSLRTIERRLHLIRKTWEREELL